MDTTTATDRSHAEALDADDPLATFRDRFVIDDADVVYLNGNSLGRLPRATGECLAVATEEWGRELVGGWDTWIDLPGRVGDLIARDVVGALPGEVAVSDSTSVNLYKLASAAIDARPGRRAIVTDTGNFPTDRYVLEGLAAARGLELRLVEGVGASVGHDVALATFSHVDYRTGELADMAGISAAAHDAGALVLWDVSHSAGVVPLRLHDDGADVAVGCTYKYLNAGPGAPAFLYVRDDLQPRLTQPVWGWFGQREQFAMGARYDPQPDVRRFLVGTPPVLALHAVEVGAALVGEADVDRLRAKSLALSALLIELYDAWLAPLGFSLATPRDGARRGSHVALRHADAAAIVDGLRRQAGVVVDFRAPDIVRFGLTPLDTRFVDVWDAMHRLRGLVASGETQEVVPGRVP